MWSIFYKWPFLTIYYCHQFKTEHNISLIIVYLHLYGFVTYGAIYYLLTSGYCYNFYTLWLISKHAVMLVIVCMNIMELHNKEVLSAMFCK